MGQNTRIFNRFTGYSLKDCECRFCLYYGGKRKGCALPQCCCEEELAPAQETAVTKKRGEFLPCGTK